VFVRISQNAVFYQQAARLNMTRLPTPRARLPAVLSRRLTNYMFTSARSAFLFLHIFKKWPVFSPRVDGQESGRPTSRLQNPRLVLLVLNASVSRRRHGMSPAV